MANGVQQEDIIQDTLSEAWELFRDDFVLYVVAGLLLILATIVSLGILSGPLTVGFIKLIDRRRAGDTCSPVDIFDGFSEFGASFIASGLVFLGVFVGALLFLLPGLLFAIAMTFTFQAIALDGETATGGMSRSYEIVKSNIAVSIVFLVIMLVLSGIGSAVIFGTLITMPFCLIMMTLAYQRLAPNN